MPVRMDYETYSEFDISLSGHRYVNHPSTEVLCLSVKVDDQPTRLWTPACGTVKEWWPDLVYRLQQGDTCHAWNAAFELNVTNAQAGQRIEMPTLRLEQMRDSMARAAQMALPRGMGNCAKALRLPIQKDEVGKKVMLKLTKPHEPTKAEPFPRYTPENSPGLFRVLYQYCVNDTDTEAGIDIFLGPMSDYEQKIWEMDYRINARGVPVDVPMVKNVIRMRDQFMHRLELRCIELCGIGPSKAAQLLAWINRNGFHFPMPDEYGNISMQRLKSMEKESLVLAAAAIEHGKATCLEAFGNAYVCNTQHPIYEVIKIRQQASQTSIAKFDAILRSMDDDSRVRNMFVYHGAGPGRWTGRVVQMQNLKRPIIGNDLTKEFKKSNPEFNLHVELARLIPALSLKGLEMIFPKPMDALSSLVRCAFRAEPGHILTVSDYSSVEARIIAWLSGEEWRLEVFRTHGKIYEATAARLSGKELHEIGKDSKERQSGKVTELALGFQGGKGALVRMGAIDKYGLKYKELGPLVKAWRATSPAIVAMWAGIELAIITAMQTGRVQEAYRCRFGMDGKDFFKIQLPSGRMLAYAYPRLKTYTRVWNDDANRFETYNPRYHNTNPHMRKRVDPDTGVWGEYEHEGFRPQNATVFIFEGENSLTRQWVEDSLYGGKATENIVQGIGACLLRTGLLNTEAAGYQNILHVHDEGGSQNPIGFGSAKHYSDLLCAADPWAEGLPLKAVGYQEPEYRKD